MTQDRNFDDLAPRFARNIYDSMKGKIRLAVLQRDFNQHIPALLSAETGCDWRVLDAGAGQGQFGLFLAESGCRLVLNDISEKMLNYARDNLQQRLQLGTVQPEKVEIVQGPLQGLLGSGNGNSYHLVICHAVIEWVAEPKKFVEQLNSLVAPGGYLSLIFYNFNGLAFKNLLRTNFHKFDYNNFKAFRGSLTPTQPQNPREVLTWLNELQLEVLCKSGIRVFNDYILDPEMRARDTAGVLAKELEYSQREPFWEMARYIHFLAQKAR